VDLAARTSRSVPVGADPTDLDLLPDGSGAVVVSRGAGEVAVFDFDDPTAPERVIRVPEGTRLGAASFAADDRAVLYSTVTSVARFAVWDTVTDTMLLQPLLKPATGVSRTPDGSSLLVAHGPADRDDGLTPEPYRRRPALSLVSLTDFRSNTIGLASPVLSMASSADGQRGYVVLEEEPVIEILDHRQLTFESVTLRSVPEFLGVLPDLDGAGGDEPAAWVSQAHPLGRLSFYDPDDGRLQTITGFELNAAIEE
jgi:DNA-binding beta-propeller fold protein YncE